MTHASRLVHPLPQDDHTNGWSAILPKRTPCPTLQGDLHVDWLVIGAGYAGIAAARRLAEQQPNASIAIVDAGVAGDNASGRNSGFAIDLPHAAGFSPEMVEQGKQAIRVNRWALDMLNGLVQKHAIACDWQRAGRYHAAVSPRIAERDLRAYARYLQAWDEPFEWLERAQLRERLGTDYYHATIYTPGTYLLNPAALARGLWDSLPAQIQRFENSPVLEAQWHDSTPWVHTAHGRIQAKGVIVAANAFSHTFGIFRQQQVPMLLFASLTAPLSPAERQQLGSEPQWGVTPAHGVVGSTLRLTADGRLLIRQGFEYSPSLRTTEARRAQARAMNLQLLRQRFPQLPTLELEHFWMGWLAVSHNHAPAFGAVGPRTWAVSCCNGSGIVRHTAAGSLIADQALGQGNPLTADFLAQGQANHIPPRPLRDMGIALYLMRERWQGRTEQ